jgi:DNA-binding NtrC family response regulator
MVASETPTPQAFTVRRLIIEPKADRPRRFAILDDDLDIARGLAAGLIELGYEAAAFSSEAQLEATLQFDAFDGYVIDWVLASGTAEALVAKLRSQNATCPIALLTGKAGSKEVDEKALVATIEQHGLLFLQKPVTASLAASQFNAAFSNR